MKVPFRFLAFSLVLLSTTFCSKDKQSPAPDQSVTNGASATANNPYPLGFNPQTCFVDETGMEVALYDEARYTLYNQTGYWYPDAEYATVKSNISSAPFSTTDVNGHVTGIPYSDRVNNFTDGINAQLSEYDYYVYWAALHGADVQSAEDIKAIIQEQYDATVPLQPYEYSTLSAQDQENINLVVAAVQPQMQRSFRLFDALYQCEDNVSGLSRESGKKSAQRKVVSFKEFVAQRKNGRIVDPTMDQGYTAQRGKFWKSLKKAAHIFVTVIAGPVKGALEGIRLANRDCNGSNSVANAMCYKVYILGGATIGLVRGVIDVFRDKCLFGPC